MRLIVTIQAQTRTSYMEIGNVQIQGLIYNLIQNTNYHYLHNKKGFKYFTFSNIFPVSDYTENCIKHFIISSPDKKFIRTLYHRFKTIDTIRLGSHKFRILGVKTLNDFQWFKSFQTATPLVLYEDNVLNRYYSFRDKGYDLDFFFKRVKENALKKYNSFYDDEYNPAGPIFESVQFHREVCHSLKYHQEKSFLVIGSTWKQLKLNNDYSKKFYQFIVDAGLGEKNSLGYGFLNLTKYNNLVKT